MEMSSTKSATEQREEPPRTDRPTDRNNSTAAPISVSGATTIMTSGVFIFCLFFFYNKHNQHDVIVVERIYSVSLVKARSRNDMCLTAPE